MGRFCRVPLSFLLASWLHVLIASSLWVIRHVRPPGACTVTASTRPRPAPGSVLDCLPSAHHRAFSRRLAITLPFHLIQPVVMPHDQTVSQHSLRLRPEGFPALL